MANSTPSRGRPRVDGRVLVLFAYGKGYALAYQATDPVHEFVLTAGGSIQEFNLAGLAAYAVQSDGLYCGTLALTEGGLVINDLRQATEKEWANHCAGEWPWYTPESTDSAGAEGSEGSET